MARKKEPERIEINQEKIAQIAKEMFIKNGYESTKMEEIAKKIGMSKTTLYVYFRNKAEIKNYLFLKAMNIFYDELCLVQRFKKESFHDRFMQICDVLCMLMDNYPDEFNIVVQNINIENGALKEDSILERLYEQGEKVNEILLDIFKDVLNGERESKRVIFSKWGNLYGLIILAYNKEEYIMQQFGLTKEEFLKKGFEDLFAELNIT